MSKREKLKRYIIFFIGLFFSSFGVSFVTKANLGTSPISSIPYVLSLATKPTLGEYTIFFSLFLIALQILILGKKFKKESLLQIPVSIAFGYFIDFSMFLLSWLNPENYAYRGVALILGCIILGFGVYAEVIADVVMLPGEAFVKAVTVRFKTDFGTTKVCFDASMTIIAGVSAFIIFNKLNGVGIGTIVAALIVGIIARFFIRKLVALTELLLGKPEESEEQTFSNNGNIVITIAREYGSGGREIGKLVAQKLGIDYYDTEVLSLTAQKSGKSQDYIEMNDQKITRNLLFNVYSQADLYSSKDEDSIKSIFKTEQEIIKEIASKSSCVIVGRLSNFILKDSAFNVFLHANKDDRIKRVATRDNITEADADKKINRVNKERHEHCRLVTGREWGLAKHYDLSINTSLFGTENTAEYISQMAKIKF